MPCRKPSKQAQELPYPVEAFRVSKGPHGYIKRANLYRVPCFFCGKPTKLKTAGEINRQIKKVKGVFCKASCRRGEELPSTCQTCAGKIERPCKKNGRWSRFCSKQCYSLWQSSSENTGENNPNWRAGTTMMGDTLLRQGLGVSKYSNVIILHVNIVAGIQTNSILH